MTTRDFLDADHDLDSDCISDDDSEYIPSTSHDSGDEVQPSPKKKKCLPSKAKSSAKPSCSKAKSSAKPSCSRTLALDDSDSDDDIPLARLVQKDSEHNSLEDVCLSEEELTRVLDAPMWASGINFEAPDTTFKGEEEPSPETLKEPLAYFREFVTNQMIENIAEQTNLYSVQKDGKSVNTSKAEIDLFIGLFLRMGLVQAYSLRALWAEETRYDKVADHMARNRYEKLASHIHFTDNSTVMEEEKKNKSWKIAPWFDGLKTSLTKLPQEEFSAVDEIMIPFKGRSDIKQFMRNKPHKWGFKMWGRAGASGILYEFDVYQGASVTSDDGLSKSSQVVIKMTSNIPLGLNFKVFADNFFSSLPLVKILQSKRIFYVRVNRLKGLELKSEKELKTDGSRGAFDHAIEVNSGVVAVRWYDNRPVDLLSSYIGVEPVTEVQRYDKKKKTKRIIKVSCPAIVKEYNKFMGGIDLHDMLTALHVKVPSEGKTVVCVHLLLHHPHDGGERMAQVPETCPTLTGQASHEACRFPGSFSFSTGVTNCDSGASSQPFCLAKTNLRLNCTVPTKGPTSRNAPGWAVSPPRIQQYPKPLQAERV